MPQGYKQLTRIGDLNQVHFAIMDHEDKYYTLEEVRPYIDIKLVLVEFGYTNGKTKTSKYASVKDCTESDFRDEDQRKHFQLTIYENAKHLCVGDEALDWKIEGNIQDHHIFHKANSYFML